MSGGTSKTSLLVPNYPVREGLIGSSGIQVDPEVPVRGRTKFIENTLQVRNTSNYAWDSGAHVKMQVPSSSGSAYSLSMYRDSCQI